MCVPAVFSPIGGREGDAAQKYNSEKVIESYNNN